MNFTAILDPKSNPTTPMLKINEFPPEILKSYIFALFNGSLKVESLEVISDLLG